MKNQHEVLCVYLRGGTYVVGGGGGKVGGGGKRISQPAPP